MGIGLVCQMDRLLITSLRTFLKHPKARDLLDAARVYVSNELQTDEAREVATFPIAIDVYTEVLPEEIGSCRVSAMRKGTQGRRERHPNADQYVASLEGTGEIRTLKQSSWRGDIVSRDKEGLHYVPANVWHQPIPEKHNDWIVVAFHTASEVEDEYRD